ncbi:cupin domain-containing protein [Roseibium sp. SCP14]|uniref:cupin domain-containing protein n=1 Tax=Roseibium sp. SCP14 TaxID=3141375 RepID=UPI00333CDB7D
MQKPQKLDPNGPTGTLDSISVVDPATVIDGRAVETGASYMGAKTDALLVGVWDSTPYAEVFSGEGYPADEFCQVLSGSVTLTCKDGTSQTFSAGDTYIVNKGWCGEFRVNEQFRKYYVMAA